MNVRIRCPEDPSHNQFTASAHVSEMWVTDEIGQFLETLPGYGEVTAGPDFDCSTCHICGADAIVEDL